MIYHSYGEFTDNQLDIYKKDLHKKIFWLILYKDPKTKDKYKNVDFNKYITGLLKSLGGLNSLLSYPAVMIPLLSDLEAARLESEKEDFDWQVYRKLILDSQSYVDKIGVI